MAWAIVEIVRELSDFFPFKDMAILCGYTAQRNSIRDTMEQYMLYPEVSTIDAYQGRENKFIILSLTCTDSVGFFTDNRRVNVAMSRVQERIWLVGNHDFWMRQEGAPIVRELGQKAMVLPAAEWSPNNCNTLRRHF
jgi:superfamily I DNA and/or RNA helicase